MTTRQRDILITIVLILISAICGGLAAYLLTSSSGFTMALGITLSIIAVVSGLFGVYTGVVGFLDARRRPAILELLNHGLAGLDKVVRGAAQELSKGMENASQEMGKSIENAAQGVSKSIENASQEMGKSADRNVDKVIRGRAKEGGQWS